MSMVLLMMAVVMGCFQLNGVYDDDDCVDFDRFADGGGRVYDDNDCDHFTDF